MSPSLLIRSIVAASILTISFEARMPMSRHTIFSFFVDMQSHSFVTSKAKFIKNLFLNLESIKEAAAASLLRNIWISSSQFINMASNLHAERHSPHPIHLAWSINAFRIVLNDMAFTGHTSIHKPHETQ